MCQMQQSIEPDAKLKKMIGFLKILLAINVVVVIAHMIIAIKEGKGSNALMEFFCCMLLLMAIAYVNYMGMGLFIFFALYNSVFIFIDIGTFFQVMIIKPKEHPSYYKLGVDTFAFCFFVFAIIIGFPVYKEMKAQYLGSIGAGGSAPRDEENYGHPPASTNTSSNFRAFSGRGVAVGGN